MSMTIEQLLDETIRRGIEGAKRDYNRPDNADKLRGSLAGFERARQLPITYEHFEAEIMKLEGKLRDMMRNNIREGYWERRCYQAEIQWVFEVLKVAWRRYPLSGNAVMTYQAILTGESPTSVPYLNKYTPHVPRPF